MVGILGQKTRSDEVQSISLSVSTSLLAKQDTLQEIADNALYLDDSMLTMAAGERVLLSRLGGTVNKFGENPNVAVTTTEDVWDGGGTYSFPTTATITHIRSAVDSATTQGMTIEVQGLNASWAAVTQTKDLDGTNSTIEVSLDTPLIRVFRMKVLEDAVADQDIWAGDDDFLVADAKAIIQAGNNQTLMAIYTVPAGKTAYVTQYYADNETDGTRHPNSARFKLWVADRANSYEFQLKHMRSIPELGDGIVQSFRPYLKATEKSDIKLSCSISGSVTEDGHPHAGFDLILVNN